MDDGELLEKADVCEGQDNSAEKRPDFARETSNVYPFVWRGERQPYEVYKTKAKTPRLIIWYGIGGGAFNRTSFAYRDLAKVNANEAGTELELIYRFQVIKIRGKNMKGIIDAIDAHACDFIQEFHHLRFEKPDPTAPVISEIEFPLDDPE